MLRIIREDSNMTGTANMTTTTTSKEGSNESNSNTGRGQYSQDHVYGSRLGRMPDTSDDLDRNWLTAMATPRFSRAGLPGVVMPIRADARSKGTSTNTSNMTAASRRKATTTTPDSEMKGNYVDPRVASLTATSPDSMMQKREMMPLNRQTLFHKRQTTEKGKRRATSPQGKDHNERDNPFPSDFKKTSSSISKHIGLQRILSVGFGSDLKDRRMSTEPQGWDDVNREVGIDTKDEVSEIEGDSKSGERWQWSSLFRPFLSERTNKSSRATMAAIA